MGNPDPHQDVNSAAQSEARADEFLHADYWSQPLTIAECEAESIRPRSARPTPVNWIMPPKEPGCSPFVSLWVRRSVMSDRRVQDWLHDDLPSLLRMVGASRPPENLEQVRHLIAAEFEAEGGVDTVQLVSEEVAERHAQQHSSSGSLATVTRLLPSGARITVPTSTLTPRSPVVRLVYPADGDVTSLLVLRDAALGRLASLSDTLAEEYLVPVGEIVFCILTGLSPRLAPIRLGLRFRRFDVDGVPVTGTSRVIFEVDPQLEATELARTFAQWQRAAGVKPSKASPKLVPLGSDLVGRLRLVPADRVADSGAHPAEVFGIENRSWRLVPAVPWLRLAREIDYDPKLIRSRAAAVIRLLLPLDAPSVPQWLPGQARPAPGRGRSLRRRPAPAS
jgi:hypothetical protein